MHILASPLEGASEWLRCKALRMRAQGVYWSTWPSPNPIATKQIGYYDTPPPKHFPHPKPFFGFNTSCFWRRKVLYLYRDMGGASAPPFFRHFPFKIGDLEAHPGKIRGRQRKIRGRQRKIRGRQRKTVRREGKIGRRKVFLKVKNVNVESPKKRSKLLFFSARSFLFPLHQCSWMGSSKRLSFFGGHELFWLGRHELILFELELFTNCSELTRQLMGINGETFLAGSAPKKN